MRNKKIHAFKVLCLGLSLALFFEPIVPVFSATPSTTTQCVGKSCPAATATVVVSKPVVVNKTILANKLKTIKPASVLSDKPISISPSPSPVQFTAFNFDPDQHKGFHTTSDRPSQLMDPRKLFVAGSISPAISSQDRLFLYYRKAGDSNWTRTGGTVALAQNNQDFTAGTGLLDPNTRYELQARVVPAQGEEILSAILQYETPIPARIKTVRIDAQNQINVLSGEMESDFDSTVHAASLWTWNNSTPDKQWGWQLITNLQVNSSRNFSFNLPSNVTCREPNICQVWILEKTHGQWVDMKEVDDEEEEEPSDPPCNDCVSDELGRLMEADSTLGEVQGLIDAGTFEDSDLEKLLALTPADPNCPECVQCGSACDPRAYLTQIDSMITSSRTSVLSSLPQGIRRFVEDALAGRINFQQLSSQITEYVATHVTEFISDAARSAMNWLSGGLSNLISSLFPEEARVAASRDDFDLGNAEQYPENHRTLVAGLTAWRTSVERALPDLPNIQRQRDGSWLNTDPSDWFSQDNLRRWETRVQDAYGQPSRISGIFRRIASANLLEKYQALAAGQDLANIADGDLRSAIRSFRENYLTPAWQLLENRIQIEHSSVVDHLETTAVEAYAESQETDHPIPQEELALVLAIVDLVKTDLEWIHPEETPAPPLRQRVTLTINNRQVAGTMQLLESWKPDPVGAGWTSVNVPGLFIPDDLSFILQWNGPRTRLITTKIKEDGSSEREITSQDNETQWSKIVETERRDADNRRIIERMIDAKSTTPWTRITEREETDAQGRRTITRVVTGKRSRGTAPGLEGTFYSQLSETETINNQGQTVIRRTLTGWAEGPWSRMEDESIEGSNDLSRTVYSRDGNVTYGSLRPDGSFDPSRTDHADGSVEFYEDRYISRLEKDGRVVRWNINLDDLINTSGEQKKITAIQMGRAIKDRFFAASRNLDISITSLLQQWANPASGVPIDPDTANVTNRKMIVESITLANGQTGYQMMMIDEGDHVFTEWHKRPNGEFIPVGSPDEPNPIIYRTEPKRVRRFRTAKLGNPLYAPIPGTTPTPALILFQPSFTRLDGQPVEANMDLFDILTNGLVREAEFLSDGKIRVHTYGYQDAPRNVVQNVLTNIQRTAVRTTTPYLPQGGIGNSRWTTGQGQRVLANSAASIPNTTWGAQFSQKLSTLPILGNITHFLTHEAGAETIGNFIFGNAAGITAIVTGDPRAQLEYTLRLHRLLRTPTVEFQQLLNGLTEAQRRELQAMVEEAERKFIDQALTLRGFNPALLRQFYIPENFQVYSSRVSTQVDQAARDPYRQYRQAREGELTNLSSLLRRWASELANQGRDFSSDLLRIAAIPAQFLEMGIDMLPLLVVTYGLGRAAPALVAPGNASVSAARMLAGYGLYATQQTLHYYLMAQLATGTTASFANLRSAIQAGNITQMDQEFGTIAFNLGLMAFGSELNRQIKEKLGEVTKAHKDAKVFEDEYLGLRERIRRFGINTLTETEQARYLQLPDLMGAAVRAAETANAQLIALIPRDAQAEARMQTKAGELEALERRLLADKNNQSLKDEQARLQQDLMQLLGGRASPEYLQAVNAMTTEIARIVARLAQIETELKGSLTAAERTARIQERNTLQGQLEPLRTQLATVKASFSETLIQLARGRVNQAAGSSSNGNGGSGNSNNGSPTPAPPTPSALRRITTASVAALQGFISAKFIQSIDVLSKAAKSVMNGSCTLGVKIVDWMRGLELPFTFRLMVRLTGLRLMMGVDSVDLLSMGIIGIGSWDLLDLLKAKTKQDPAIIDKVRKAVSDLQAANKEGAATDKVTGILNDLPLEMRQRVYAEIDNLLRPEGRTWNQLSPNRLAEAAARILAELRDQYQDQLSRIVTPQGAFDSLAINRSVRVAAEQEASNLNSLGLSTPSGRLEMIGVADSASGQVLVAPRDGITIGQDGKPVQSRLYYAILEGRARQAGLNPDLQFIVFYENRPNPANPSQTISVPVDVEIFPAKIPRSRAEREAIGEGYKQLAYSLLEGFARQGLRLEILNAIIPTSTMAADLGVEGRTLAEQAGWRPPQVQPAGTVPRVSVSSPAAAFNLNSILQALGTEAREYEAPIQNSPNRLVIKYEGTADTLFITASLERPGANGGPRISVGEPANFLYENGTLSLDMSPTSGAAFWMTGRGDSVLGVALPELLRISGDKRIRQVEIRFGSQRTGIIGELLNTFSQGSPDQLVSQPLGRTLAGSDFVSFFTFDGRGYVWTGVRLPEFAKALREGKTGSVRKILDELQAAIDQYKVSNSPLADLLRQQLEFYRNANQAVLNPSPAPTLIQMGLNQWLLASGYDEVQSGNGQQQISFFVNPGFSESIGTDRTRRTQVIAALRKTAQALQAGGSLPNGVKKLNAPPGSDFYEARVNDNYRIIFQRRGGRVEFLIILKHEDVQRYLDNQIANSSRGGSGSSNGSNGSTRPRSVETLYMGIPLDALARVVGQAGGLAARGLASLRDLRVSSLRSLLTISRDGLVSVMADLVTRCKNLFNPRPAEPPAQRPVEPINASLNRGDPSITTTYQNAPIRFTVGDEAVQVSKNQNGNWVVAGEEVPAGRSRYLYRHNQFPVVFEFSQDNVTVSRPRWLRRAREDDSSLPPLLQALLGISDSRRPFQTDPSLQAGPIPASGILVPFDGAPIRLRVGARRAVLIRLATGEILVVSGERGEIRQRIPRGGEAEVDGIKIENRNNGARLSNQSADNPEILRRVTNDSGIDALRRLLGVDPAVDGAGIRFTSEGGIAEPPPIIQNQLPVNWSDVPQRQRVSMNFTGTPIEFRLAGSDGELITLSRGANGQWAITTRGRTYALNLPNGRGRVHLGRAEDGSYDQNILLLNLTISRDHLILEFDGNRVTIRDPGSRNGTRYRAGSGTPATPTERFVLAARGLVSVEFSENGYIARGNNRRIGFLDYENYLDMMGTEFDTIMSHRIPANGIISQDIRVRTDPQSRTITIENRGNSDVILRNFNILPQQPAPPQPPLRVEPLAPNRMRSVSFQPQGFDYPVTVGTSPGTIKVRPGLNSTFTVRLEIPRRNGSGFAFQREISARVGETVRIGSDPAPANQISIQGLPREFLSIEFLSPGRVILRRAGNASGGMSSMGGGSPLVIAANVMQNLMMGAATPPDTIFDPELDHWVGGLIDEYGLDDSTTVATAPATGSNASATSAKIAATASLKK